MSDNSFATSAAAEAARYTLLRRLAPSMRHHLVVNLQPISMVQEIMDRRLRAPEPNLGDVREGAQKISNYSKAALASCVDVVTWLAPDEAAHCTAAQGVAECLSLILTGFTFRGFGLRDEGGDVEGEVRRASFRNVVTGALLWLSDEYSPPAQISIRAERANEGLAIVLSLQAGVGEPGFGSPPTYRSLTWGDIQALAEADKVTLSREGSTVRVTIPWAAARA
jgi:hypothetical protein